MTVYVDTLRAWGLVMGYHGEQADHAQRVGSRHGHQWCHMFSDEADCEELHAMARRIGLKRSWFQHNHYDLVPTKRALALKNGAVEVDDRRAVEIWRAHRRGAPTGKEGE